jgi:hypothetical protein
MKVRKNHLRGDVLAREVIGLTMTLSTLSTLSLCGLTKEIPNPIKFVVYSSKAVILLRLSFSIPRLKANIQGARHQ